MTVKTEKKVVKDATDSKSVLSFSTMQLQFVESL